MNNAKTEHFNFSDVSSSQRSAIQKMEEAERRFVDWLETFVPACQARKEARKLLRKALMKCNEAICFNQPEKYAKKV